MDKQHICKICGKPFSCGKAVGGHMRNHLAFLPLPPKENQEDSSLLSPSSSSITHAANQDQNHQHQSNLLKPVVRRKRSKRPTPRIIAVNSTREVEAAISLVKPSRGECSKTWKEVKISRNGKEEEADEKFTQEVGDDGGEDDTGGYKKTHVGNAASASTSIATTLISNTSTKKCRDWIDLNLPPEEEDQDKDENSNDGFK